MTLEENALDRKLRELKGNPQGILDSSGSELKPCPFCGTKAKIKGGLEAQENYSVWCENLHHMDGGYDREKMVAQWNRRAMPAITPAMIEAGAQRLVAWEDDGPWPDSWDSMAVAAARNDAERVLRSALNARADHIADASKMVKGDVYTAGSVILPAGKTHERAIVVAFQSDDDLRAAIAAGQCRFTVFGGDV